MRQLATALMVLSAAGCAADALRCPAGDQAAVLDQLYLGGSRPYAAEVSAAEWAAFSRDEITPRFPQGFTVLEGQGQWRNADGSMAQESSRVLQVVHADDPAAAAAMREIAMHYKQRFGQEAVLRVRSPACMALY
jgi:hypothetical protein